MSLEIIALIIIVPLSLLALYVGISLHKSGGRKRQMMRYLARIELWDYVRFEYGCKPTTSQVNDAYYHILRQYQHATGATYRKALKEAYDVAIEKAEKDHK